MQELACNGDSNDNEIEYNETYQTFTGSSHTASIFVSIFRIKELIFYDSMIFVDLKLILIVSLALALYN